MNERYQLLAAINGVAIKCLVAFVWEARQLTITELEPRVGHDKNTVRKALAQLALYGLAAQVISSRETWHPTDKGRQLPLPLEALPSSGENFSPLATTTTAILNSPSQVNSSSSSNTANGEILTSHPEADAPQTANLQTLHDCGIMGKKAEHLSALPHVTPELIRAHVDQVKRDGQKLGLAICRLECGDPMPEEDEEGHSEAWIQAHSRERYTGGRYADRIRH
jgi:hypothetical protein